MSTPGPWHLPKRKRAGMTDQTDPVTGFPVMYCTACGWKLTFNVAVLDLDSAIEEEDFFVYYSCLICGRELETHISRKIIIGEE